MIAKQKSFMEPDGTLHFPKRVKRLNPAPDEEYPITMEEYDALPDSVRAEIYDGIPYAMASPTLTHQKIASELNIEFALYIRGKNGKCSVVQSFDVVVQDNPKTILEPDVLIICDENRVHDDKRLKGGPDLAVEVVSEGSVTRDYVRKLYLYRRSGVMEYWIVNPLDGLVIVYDLTKNELVPEEYTFYDSVPVHLYQDDLKIDFAAIGRRVGLLADAEAAADGDAQTADSETQENTP